MDNAPSATDASALAVRPPRRRIVRRVLIAIVLAIAAGSVAANVLLYRQAVDSYRQTAEAQLDPLGLKRTDFPPGAGPADGRVVVFFGDSRARQWPAPPAAGYRFANRGIGGQTTEQILARFDAHVAPLSPRVVVVQAGINDLKAIPLLPHRRAEIVAACKANLRTIVGKSRAGGAMVVVTTIFPPGDVPLARRPVWSDDVAVAAEEVNADLRALAGDGVVVLDAWSLLADGGTLKEGLGVDTLHLKPAGYALLNQQLGTVLAPLREAEPAIP